MRLHKIKYTNEELPALVTKTLKDNRLKPRPSARAIGMMTLAANRAAGKSAADMVRAARDEVIRNGGSSKDADAVAKAAAPIAAARVASGANIDPRFAGKLAAELTRRYTKNLQEIREAAARAVRMAGGNSEDVSHVDAELQREIAIDDDQPMPANSRDLMVIREATMLLQARAKRGIEFQQPRLDCFLADDIVSTLKELDYQLGLSNGRKTGFYGALQEYNNLYQKSLEHLVRDNIRTADRKYDVQRVVDYQKTLLEVNSHFMLAADLIDLVTKKFDKLGDLASASPNQAAKLSHKLDAA